MKKLLFILLVFTSLTSCKKEVIKPQPTTNKHFVEMYTNTGYWDSIQFYHNGVLVLSYFDKITTSGGTPQGGVEHQMTGFYAQSGDSVRLKSFSNTGLFNSWIRLNGVVVADSSFFTTSTEKTVNLTYVIP